MPYDPDRDILPISLTVRIPNLLVVRNTLPVQSVAELIAYMRANPGKLNYASAGVGSTIHLSGEIFKRMTGTEMSHVPYRGAGPAVNDLVGGQVDLMFADIPTVIKLVGGGQLRGLAVTTQRRYALAPEFPAIAETVPGYDVFSFFGVAVRAGTPPDIVKKLEADCIAVSREGVVKERLNAVTAEVVGSTSAEFVALLKTERAKWGSLITDLKLKVE
jgi:tripartite-type tricarboxylate transporter receptor subunit TctC